MQCKNMTCKRTFKCVQTLVEMNFSLSNRFHFGICEHISSRIFLNLSLSEYVLICYYNDSANNEDKILIPPKNFINADRAIIFGGIR